MGIQTDNLRQDAGGWDDLRFPVSGENLDAAQTRYSFDRFNAAVQFDSDARYPNESLAFLVQMPHGWKYGSEIRPHVHWLQTTSSFPQWMFAYKICEKNAAFTIETDFSNHTQLAVDSNAFTYTSGTLHQVSNFGSISMTGYGLSDCLVCAFFRDTTGASSAYAGADPSAADELVLEIDIHYQIDKFGSNNEFTD